MLFSDHSGLMVLVRLPDFSEKERGKVWKDYMERIMSE